MVRVDNADPDHHGQHQHRKDQHVGDVIEFHPPPDIITDMDVIRDRAVLGTI